MYDKKILIVVQSKYPEILKKFLEGFSKTTEGFLNLDLNILNGKEYGAVAINKILQKEVLPDKYDYFGVFNDDLLFTDGWLESVIPLFKQFICISAGYVETAKEDVFKKAVEKTKNDIGWTQHLYGPNAIFDVGIFRKIGLFDEQFNWSCDDLDWAWRIKLNGLISCTLKKITMAHTVGASRSKNMRAWNVLSTENKTKFYNKHGYEAYRIIRAEYKEYHNYFLKFR